MVKVTSHYALRQYVKTGLMVMPLYSSSSTVGGNIKVDTTKGLHQAS